MDLLNFKFSFLKVEPQLNHFAHRVELVQYSRDNGSIIMVFLAMHEPGAIAKSVGRNASAGSPTGQAFIDFNHELCQGFGPLLTDANPEKDMILTSTAGTQAQSFSHRFFQLLQSHRLKNDLSKPSSFFFFCQKGLDKSCME